MTHKQIIRIREKEKEITRLKREVRKIVTLRTEIKNLRIILETTPKYATYKEHRKNELAEKRRISEEKRDKAKEEFYQQTKKHEPQTKIFFDKHWSFCQCPICMSVNLEKLRKKEEKYMNLRKKWWKFWK